MKSNPVFLTYKRKGKLPLDEKSEMRDFHPRKVQKRRIKRGFDFEKNSRRRTENKSSGIHVNILNAGELAVESVRRLNKSVDSQAYASAAVLILPIAML